MYWMAIQETRSYTDLFGHRDPINNHQSMGRVQKFRNGGEILVQIVRADMLKHSYRDHAVIKPAIVVRPGNITVIAKKYLHPIFQAC